mmetsp:Transcript_38584/g.88479  ORF Transcript_38584/g.88479 Transcript_38584/m.88479 type:complete len:258 (-) Transcript_38584:1013-1786(-)
MVRKGRRMSLCRTARPCCRRGTSSASPAASWSSALVSRWAPATGRPSGHSATWDGRCTNRPTPGCGRGRTTSATRTSSCLPTTRRSASPRAWTSRTTRASTPSKAAARLSLMSLRAPSATTASTRTWSAPSSFPLDCPSTSSRRCSPSPRVRARARGTPACPSVATVCRTTDGTARHGGPAAPPAVPTRSPAASPRRTPFTRATGSTGWSGSPAQRATSRGSTMASSSGAWTPPPSASIQSAPRRTWARRASALRRA